MKAVMIGSGNVATNMAGALANVGVEIAQVYSRSMTHARALSEAVGAVATDDINSIIADADIYIVAVSDDAIAHLVQSIPDNGRLWVHTSGSTPMSALEGAREHYGVLYPMQSLSRQIAADFAQVPLFIEGCDEETTARIEAVAQRISRRVMRASSEQRRQLHIAAVFSCNFANHLWTLASDVLQEAGLPFDVMLPLIETTVEKLHHLSPALSQTGPAVRHDEHTMEAHIAMLDQPKQVIYRLLSQSIQYRHEQD